MAITRGFVDGERADILDLSGSKLKSSAPSIGLLVGHDAIGTSNIEWSMQQRPDKSGKSDRFHKV